MEGEGKEVWRDGTQYTGQFLKGMKHGQGSMTHDGKIYEGSWEKNAKHGIGFET
jgi:hypothetical protein